MSEAKLTRSAIPCAGFGGGGMLAGDPGPVGRRLEIQGAVGIGRLPELTQQPGQAQLGPRINDCPERAGRPHAAARITLCIEVHIDKHSGKANIRKHGPG